MSSMRRKSKVGRPKKRKNDEEEFKASCKISSDAVPERPKRRCSIEKKPKYAVDSEDEEEAYVRPTSKRGRKSDRKDAGARETSAAPSARLPKLDTCFGPEYPFSLPNVLSSDVNEWSVEDVLFFIEYFLSPLVGYCSQFDNEVVVEKQLDGRKMVELSINEVMFDYDCGLSERAQMNMIFRIRYLISKSSGY